MPTKLVDGKVIAGEILTGVRIQVEALDVPLQLAAVCREGDAALTSFVRLKQKAAQAAGILFSAYFVESEHRARETLQFLAADDEVHGIFLELPVPDDWNKDQLLSLIPEQKDVDGISPKSETAFERGESLVLPPPVIALRHVTDLFGITLPGVRVAVVGVGRLIGRPVAQWLRSQGAIVDLIDIATKQPEAISSVADMVICGTGVPGLVTADWVKEGATVIDFGFNNGKGDVDVESVQPRAGILARVPGGMGPLVVAAVMENLVTLATK